MKMMITYMMKLVPLFITKEVENEKKSERTFPYFSCHHLNYFFQSLPSTSMAAICNIDVLICLPVCSFFVLILFFTLHSFLSIFLNYHYWSIEIGRQFVGIKLQGSSINDCVRSTNIEFTGDPHNVLKYNDMDAWPTCFPFEVWKQFSRWQPHKDLSMEI